MINFLSYICTVLACLSLFNHRWKKRGVVSLMSMSLCVCLCLCIVTFKGTDRFLCDFIWKPVFSGSDLCLVYICSAVPGYGVLKFLIIACFLFEMSLFSIFSSDHYLWQLLTVKSVSEKPATDIGSYWTTRLKNLVNN